MKVTRTQLYEEIWQTPISTLSKKYGVSDTAIRKKCDKYNIPRPDNKYWGLSRAGHAPSRPPLPDFNGDDEISFSGDMANRSTTNDSSMGEQEPAFSGYDEHRRSLLLHIRDSLLVESELDKPHPVIESHQAIFSKARKEYGYDRQYVGRVNMYPYPNELDTSKVSENTFSHLYRILNTLFYAIEKAGGSIVRDNHVMIVIEDVRIQLIFIEKCTRQRLPKEQRRDKYDDGWRFMPTGLLTIKMDTPHPCWDSKIHMEWKESKRYRLEDDIPVIFQYVAELPQYIKRVRMEYEDRLKREREELQRLEKLKRIHANEFDQISKLVHEAKMWETAETLRCYIAHLEEKLQGETVSNLAEIRSKIEWAKQKVAWLDPLTQEGDSILTEADKLRLIK